MKGCVQWTSVYGIKQNTAELSSSNADGSFTTATNIELVLESLTKTNPIAEATIVFGTISSDLLFIWILVCCIYSLESPR